MSFLNSKLDQEINQRLPDEFDTKRLVAKLQRFFIRPKARLSGLEIEVP